jgi:hypothetical protein
MAPAPAEEEEEALEPVMPVTVPVDLHNSIRSVSYSKTKNRVFKKVEYDISSITYINLLSIGGLYISMCLCYNFDRHL